MIRTLPDPESVCREAAALFVRQARLSVTHRERFAVALSGGRTARRLYEILSDPLFRNDVAWEKTLVFRGNEQCVPADDRQEPNRKETSCQKT